MIDTPSKLIYYAIYHIFDCIYGFQYRLLCLYIDQINEYMNKQIAQINLRRYVTLLYI